MMSLLGLAMVILSFVIFDKETVIPGFNALLPRLERACYYFHKPGTIVHHLLSFFTFWLGSARFPMQCLSLASAAVGVRPHRWFDVITQPRSNNPLPW